LWITGFGKTFISNDIALSKTELGADTDPFLLHIYAALAEKERA
jgi:hypothetical protein